MVTRKAQGGRRELVVGGITSLFYKTGRRASRFAESERDGPGNSSATLLKRLSQTSAQPMGVSAGGPTALSQEILGLIEQGESLFFKQTFDGNGRTCGTCHRAENHFTLDPAFIATLPDDDPLFVAEFNQQLADLENPTLLRGSRGLILENIDGFDEPPVFRDPPPVVNLTFTGPYGLSGEFASLSDFSVGAITQHFPKTLDRVAGVDFRMPTQEELDALEAFQLSIFVPRRRDFDLDGFLTTELQRRGRDLFFGVAKCSECHGGTVLSGASQALGGGNQSFNTGVVNLPVNAGPNEGFGPLPSEAGGAREFSTPQLFNVKNTAPFFHDNSAATLREAVAFYDGVQFNQSPAASPGAAGPINITPDEIDAIVAFLEALVDPEKVVDVRLVGPSSSVTVGDSFSVSVQVEPNGQQLTGVEVFLTFDPQALQVAGAQIQADTTTLEAVLANAFDNSAGTIHYAAGTLSRPFPIGTFTLATVTFAAGRTGIHTISPSVQGSGATKADYGGADVLDEVTGTQITVVPIISVAGFGGGGASPTPAPTPPSPIPTPSPTPTPPATVTPELSSPTPLLDVSIAPTVSIGGDADIRTTEGEKVKVAADGVVSIKRDPDTGQLVLSLPLELPQGASLSDFSDPESGVEIRTTGPGQREAIIPLTAPTAAVALRLRATISNDIAGTGIEAKAPIERLLLEAEAQTVDLSAQKPEVGPVTVGFQAELRRMPKNARMSVAIFAEPNVETSASFAHAAREIGTSLSRVAYSVNFGTSNLESEAVISSALLSFTVGRMWVEISGGPELVRVIRIGDTGTRQVLEPSVTCSLRTCTVTALSPLGLSEFGIVAVSEDIRRPTALFSADPVRGLAPLTVRFADESSHGPVSWQWDFGDGSAPGEKQNPTHRYTKPGTYAVTLTAGNPAGSSTLTKKGLVVVGWVQTDLDADGTTNAADIELLAEALGSRRGEATFLETADLNNDGTVDLRDAALFGAALPVEGN